jgi:dolichol-phosphate mannosyltransferase
MKWLATLPYVRRLIGKGGGVPLRDARIGPLTLLGPLGDFLAYCVLTAAGASSARSQSISFLIATALYYLPYRGAGARTSGGSLRLQLAVVILTAFVLRGGVFALLTSRWGWPGHAAMLLAVATTGAVLRPGYAYCISSTARTIGSDATWRLGALGLVVFALALRLIYSGQVELLPEETYYWNYSRHLAFGYLDHPPMVGWLISAGTAVFGDTEFGVRIGALCCGAVASFFLYRLTRSLFGEASALVAVLLAQTLPFFFLAGMLMTPDAPLTAAWAAALYFLERALIGGRSEAWWRAGLCLGLGLLSKYTIGLLGLSMFIFMLLDSRSRRWFRRWEPYGAASLALAVFSPVIFWNYQNDWASFAFQTSRRLADRPQFALHKLIAGALVLLTPTGLVSAALLLLRRTHAADLSDASVDGRDASVDGRDARVGGRDASMDEARKWRFMQMAVGVPLSVFAVFSLRHEVKLDWTGAPWVAAVPALAYGIVHSAQAVQTGLRAWIRAAWPPTLAGLLLFYAAGLYYLALGIPGVGYSKHSELIPVGWQEFGARIRQLADDTEKASGKAPLIVGMDRYAIASELAFYAPDRAKSVNETTSAHLFGQVGLMYERWFPVSRQEGRTLLLVAWDRGDLASQRVAASVERLSPIEEGLIMRDNRVIRHYYYRLADGYRGIREPQ